MMEMRLQRATLLDLLGQALRDAWTLPRRVLACWLAGRHRWRAMAVKDVPALRGVRVCRTCRRQEVLTARVGSTWMAWGDYFWVEDAHVRLDAPALDRDDDGEWEDAAALKRSIGQGMRESERGEGQPLDEVLRELGW